MSEVQLIDRLIAIPITIMDWWNRLVHRCPGSPDGRHFQVVQDSKYGCKYCGKPMTRVAPGTDGVDR